jgi:hypothetical protein
MQAERKKKRRAGKKEQVKREGRKERELPVETSDDEFTDSNEIPAFELRNAGFKGLGLFATRDIEPGERIIQEIPLFILPKEDTLNSAIIESFVNLNPEERAAYLDLSFHATCSEEHASQTSTAGHGAVSSTNEETPETHFNHNDFPAEQKDLRSRASAEQPHVPAKGLESHSDSPSSCSTPELGSTMPPARLGKLQLFSSTESQATRTPSPSGVDLRADSPIQGSEEKTNIWNIDGLNEALETSIAHSASEADADDDLTEHDMTEALAIRVIDTWRTNSYMLDDGVNLDYAGIGLIAARLNHSCLPNVYTAYNSTSGYITVQAIKPIAAGEELCTAYINGAGKLRSERRAQLRMWGFECSCIACAEDYDESRRQEISLLKTKVEEVRVMLIQDAASLTFARIEKNIGDMLSIATLMSEEGLMGPTLADM